MYENQIVEKLKNLNYQISFAESCTGGLLASSIINVSGSSAVISESYVTYSNEAKKKILSVNQATLDKYTVYSKEIANEMAVGLKKITNAQVCVSVTGIAESNDECICYYTIIVNNQKDTFSSKTKGLRNEVRMFYTNEILKEILQILNKLS